MCDKPGVAFRNVSKQFGATRVLDQVDLELPDRHTTAVVGESGSGKSTLLKLINGLLRPDSGVVEVSGAPVPPGDLSGFRRGIGYAVQGVGLFPHLNAHDNITLVARLSGWDPNRIVDRLARLLAMFGLDAALTARFPHELSGGQQQRVGLCRAMMLKPGLLLLDEPFSGVDPITRIGIHEEFARLQQTETTTVVLVTHDMTEAARLADHLVIVHRGRIRQAGSKNHVLAAPADDYVARLLEGLGP